MSDTLIRTARWLTGVALILAGVMATGALTRLEYTPEAEQGAIQLAWRAPVTRVEECRSPTEEELAQLPPHMRQDEICEGRALPYHLRVTVDGETLRTMTVEPSGARGDRPLYVFERIPVDSGTHRIEIEFEVEDAGTATATVEGEAEEEVEGEGEIEGEIEGEGEGEGGGERARTAGRDWPRSLVLDRQVEVAPGQVILVTYSNAVRRLTVSDGS